MGIIFAVLAILSWGMGDFLIQRSARAVGDWEALFFITFIGAIVLFPFVYGTLLTYDAFEWAILVTAGFVIFVAAILDFDALRVGKIAVIEPILALEAPVTIALATFILGEAISLMQILLMIALLAGVYLVSNKRLTGIRMRTLERGVIVAIVATIGMGMANFLYGFGSRATTPLMINWFTSAFMAAATLIYLMATSNTHKIWHHLKTHRSLILWMSACDNVAWIAYSASMLYLPIGLTTGLTESYVALAAVLGLTFNKEKLVFHQKFGLWLAVICAVAIALTVS